MLVKLAVLCVVLSYLIGNVLPRTIMPYERTFKWQIHSFNDKRELKQLLSKGSTLFKIDLYYQKRGHCYTKDTRAAKDKRGCFILTHDKPSKRVSYDSIYDYLDEILKLQSYFRDNPYTISLALCFKNNPNICNKRNGKWISLVDDLYKLTEKMKRKHNLQLEIIYDGKKEKCLRKRWPLWKYTWIRGHDPSEAFLSDDKGKAYNKFEVFNDAERSLEKDALLNWGKFSKIKRPLQVWEPNDQEPILSVANIFTAHPHTNGYAYAINIDTSMYQVYTAPVSKEDFNENIVKDLGVSMEKSAFTVIVKDNEKFLYLFIGGTTNPLLNVYQIAHKNVTLIESLSIQSIMDYPFKEVIYLGTNGSAQARDYFIVRTLNDYCLLFEFDKFFVTSVKGLPLSTILLETYSISSLSLFKHSKDNQTASVLVSYVSDTKILFGVVTVELNNYLNSKLEAKIEKSLSFGQPISEINVKCLESKCLLLYNTLSDSIIKSYIVHLGDNYEMTFEKYKAFGLGKHFSLSLVNHESLLKYLIVKDHGFCYHNEPSNKDAHVLMCDQKETEMKHILNYIHGDIKNDFNAEDNASSVCSQETITGSYDMGDFPQVSSFVYCFNNEDASSCKYEFYELHDGIQESTKDIVKKCGVSRFYEGLVLDSWQLIALDK